MAGAGGGGAIGEGVAEGRGVGGEGEEIIDFKSEVSDIVADIDGATLVELTDFDFLVAVWGLKKY